jgi:uncharacterized metal-binding protein
MDCIQCLPKHCRSTSSCGAERFDRDELVAEYTETNNQQIVESAAALVDNGRAGSLSRLQEIIAFVKSMDYKKVGLAYCYGMEKEAKDLKEVFRTEGLRMQSVSCTVGGVRQNEVNGSSCNLNVSCNPLGQAHQLNAEGVDFVILMGICLGHDILLQRNLTADFTTFVVKDRVFQHHPIAALKKQSTSAQPLRSAHTS